jgi:hypothetical protein
MAGSDKGYSCVYQTEDDKGEGFVGGARPGLKVYGMPGATAPSSARRPSRRQQAPTTPPPPLVSETPPGDVGVRLSKDLTAVAGDALMINLGRLGPLILPLSEKLIYAANLVGQKLYGKGRVKPYIPDFGGSVEHVCIHSGGRAVIDGMQKVLRLSDDAAEPSRATLYKWGNVSSSSVWCVARAEPRSWVARAPLQPRSRCQRLEMGMRSACPFPGAGSDSWVQPWPPPPRPCCALAPSSHPRTLSPTPLSHPLHPS